MQFVWFYAPSRDGIELKLSMRSVQKNFAGEAKFLLICDDKDRPRWYRGPSVHCPIVERNRKEAPALHPFRDTQHKIMVAASSSEVDDQFVWIMDDVFLLNPTTIEDLETPRFDPWYRVNKKRDWHRCIAMSFDALRSRGYPTLQYGTHLPHVFEKHKLQEMFVEFDFPKSLTLFEVVYGNRYRENAIVYSPFLHRLQRPETIARLDEISESSHVLNYVGNVFRKTMQDWLQKRFNEPTSYEA